MTKKSRVETPDELVAAKHAADSMLTERKALDDQISTLAAERKSICARMSAARDEIARCETQIARRPQDTAVVGMLSVARGDLAKDEAAIAGIDETICALHERGSTLDDDNAAAAFKLLFEAHRTAVLESIEAELEEHARRLAPSVMRARALLNALGMSSRQIDTLLVPSIAPRRPAHLMGAQPVVSATSSADEALAAERSEAVALRKTFDAVVALGERVEAAREARREREAEALRASGQWPRMHADASRGTGSLPSPSNDAPQTTRLIHREPHTPAPCSVGASSARLVALST